MRIVRDTNINFMNQRKVASIFSAVVIISGLVSLLINGGPKLSIDFKGGTIVSVQYNEEMDITTVREALSNVDIDGQVFDFSQKIADHLYDSFPNKVPSNKNLFILNKGSVGPKIGSELSGKALMAILSALGLILVYISIRFELRFALGAIAALTHDVFVTLGLFSLLGYEISLPIIAAFLTIVGYSLNDTIVIFDRIRENL